MGWVSGVWTIELTTPTAWSSPPWKVGGNPPSAQKCPDMWILDSVADDGSATMTQRMQAMTRGLMTIRASFLTLQSRLVSVTSAVPVTATMGSVAPPARRRPGPEWNSRPLGTMATRQRTRPSPRRDLSGGDGRSGRSEADCPPVPISGASGRILVQTTTPLRQGFSRRGRDRSVAPAQAPTVCGGSAIPTSPAWPEGP